VWKIARRLQPEGEVRPLVDRIVKANGGVAVQIGDRLDMPASTVHAVLVRCRVNRLTHLDRATGEPIRRYEHDHPGDLLHVDVKELGNFPDGGGWRYLGRQQGNSNRHATRDRTGAKNAYHDAKVGTAFVHTVLDDHSRVRILKRAIAQEIYNYLCQPNSVAANNHLRQTRQANNISLNQVAAALGTCPINVSRIERGIDHVREFADHHRIWLTPG